MLADAAASSPTVLVGFLRGESFGAFGRLHSPYPRDAIELLVEADDLAELELFHEYGVVGVHEGEIEVNVQVEYLAKASLAGQDDTWELDQGKDVVSNCGLGVPVLPLQREYRFEDDRFGDADSDFPTLNPGKVGGRFGRLLRVVLEEMAEEDVGVQERNSHLLSHPLESLISHGLLGGFA